MTPSDESKLIRGIALGCLAGLGLAVYLWTALAAPVVLWVDSDIDLAWAKAGLGVFHPVPPPPPGGHLWHLPKPAYLLFLRGAMRVLPPLGETRSIVVVQSVLLWASILLASLWLARRRGTLPGLLFCAVGFAFLRLRDTSSAVMPEALATALLLPIAAVLADPPERARAFAVLGLATAILFLIRPNSGGAMLLLAIVSLFLAGRGKALLLLLAGFAALATPFWWMSRSTLPGDPLHGLGYQILEASAEYYWVPSIGPWPVADTSREMARAELDRAARNWQRTLARPATDRRRELLWRSLHGLFGVEYYDARWSSTYQALSTASRVTSPFLIAVAIASLLAAPWRKEVRYAKAMGLLLIGLVLLENLLIGSNPRYVLPFLPALFLLAIWGGPTFARARWPRWIALLALFALLVGLLARQRGSLDWQWGQIERAGVTVRQKIPRGCLPRTTPATLHVRIAAPLPSGAHLTVSADGKVLFSSRDGAGRERPQITVPLPLWLLEENRHRAIEFAIESTGDYSPYSFFFFPIVPPPWGLTARRDASAVLSPTTGIRSGSLDWWAHPGEP